MTRDFVVVELGQVGEIPQHIHDGVEIFLSLKGNINLTVDGVTYFLRQHDIVLCNSGEPRRASGIVPNITLRVFISEDFFHQETGVSGAYFHCNSSQMTEKERELAYGQLRRMLMRVMQANYGKEEFQQIDLKSAVLRMLSFLLKHFQVEQKKKTSAMDDCSDIRVTKIINYINKNYHNDISLHKTAEEEHLSVHYLSRLFKKRTGVGFMEYLGQVRLDSAVNHLLHTDWPVIKIALSNGFSNVGSFNKLFMKKYGISPAKYRATRKIDSLPAGSEMGQAFRSTDEQVKYLKTLDVKLRDTYSESVHTAVDVFAPVDERFKVIGRIIRIGRVSELLKSEIQKQLEVARNKVLAEYAHFSCLYGDGMYKYKIDTYDQYEYFLVLEYLYSIGVKPFFSFGVRDFISETEDPSPEKWGAEIAAFLRVMEGVFPAAYTSGWFFEIDCPIREMDGDTAWAYYREFYDAIRQTLPHSGIGIKFEENKAAAETGYQPFVTHMKRAAEEGVSPAFIAYYSEWWEHEHFIEHSENYSLYRNYIATMIGGLLQRLRGNGVSASRVLLMEWNVLAGFSSIESKAYFRSALYADGFLNLDPHITDVAYWINAYVYEAYSGTSYLEIPSLFLFDSLKRSIFFSLTVLDRIYLDIIYQDENIIATRNDKGDLAILVMNPCYFAPELALDTSFTDSLRRIFSIRLENIHGNKVIERYHLDSERTSLYNRWTNMGLPSFIDRNVIEQLNRTTNFDYTLFEEKLEGSYTFSVALDYNELAVVCIHG